MGRIRDSKLALALDDKVKLVLAGVRVRRLGLAGLQTVQAEQ
jgi:hypothetical protein